MDRIFIEELTVLHKSVYMIGNSKLNKNLCLIWKWLGIANKRQKRMMLHIV